MIETAYVIVGGVIAGLTAGGTMAGLVLYLLKSKVSKGEAVLCRQGLTKLIELSHAYMTENRRMTQKHYEDNRQLIEKHNGENKKSQKTIRKGLAYVIAKQWGKESKIPELSGEDKDASMIIEAITEDLNGD